MNLANVAMMSNITKIAAIENAAAIWEYDPALPGNRVLGGSLDVIACVRTIAIKVSCNQFRLLPFYFRYKPQVNESNSLKSFRFNARLPIHSKSLSIAMFNGVQTTLCLIARISYDRCVVSLFYRH